VAGSPPTGGLSLGPNPVRAGDVVTFTTARSPAGDLRVYDVGGREVGRSEIRSSGADYSTRWETRDASGRPLPAGIYFARFGQAARVRLVVLGP